MEYIKKEELIEGEIYKCNTQIYGDYIMKAVGNLKNCCNSISLNSNEYNKKSTFGINSNIQNAFQYKLTTSEEKHWLNTCITADKFITFEEAMETFIPEYVVCVKQLVASAYKLGTIYKTNTIGLINSGMAFYQHNQDRFKPSTKEAYDAQFVVKEPEFVLPQYWCILRTQENYKIINDYFKNKFSHHLPPNQEFGYIGIGYNNSWSTFTTKEFEITFEQFKKYVLKEEIIEEVKIIEPLPQFKVIETIETITKVENNEGNQFFIGDTVKSPSDQKGKIISFKYSADKSNIIAITTFQINNGININKLEHYIEPKVEVKDEFILPEKWCIKVTNRNLDYFKSLSGYKTFNLGNWSSIIGLNNACDTLNVEKQYVEITFDQFKKYVLKEEEPIIIAESMKDMLVLKSKNINSIVLPQETLLEKAKRLYPIGTEYICVYSGRKFNVSSQNFEQISNSKIHAENLKGCLLYGDKWAEIIE